MSVNSDLISQFQILQNYYRDQGDRGRTIAYGKAIVALRGVRKKIRVISDVKNVRGIGPKITQKIKEYLETGEIKVVKEKHKFLQEKTTSPKQKILNKFQTVWGIGPKKAIVLYNKGFRTIRDLHRNKDLLTTQQKIGLKYRKDLLKRIPRYMITSLEVILRYFLNGKYGKKNYALVIAGSYRREKSDSGDIDCLLTSEKFTLKDIVKYLQKKRIIKEILSVRDTKFMGIVSCPNNTTQNMRLDIEFVPKKEWGTALLYFTGSKQFNVHMRADAKRKGYQLNEYGLFDIRTGKKVLKAPTERDIFKFLDLVYVKPKRR